MPILMDKQEGIIARHGRVLAARKLGLIWAKKNFAISRGHYHGKHEPCWYAVRKGSTGHWAGGHSQTTVWEIDKNVASETGHSAQKPVECMRRPIENNSSPGQAVCLWLGDHHYRSRDDRAQLSRHRDQPGLCRRGSAALGGIHWPGGHARR